MFDMYKGKFFLSKGGPLISIDFKSKRFFYGLKDQNKIIAQSYIDLKVIKTLSFEYNIGYFKTDNYHLYVLTNKEIIEFSCKLEIVTKKKIQDFGGLVADMTFMNLEAQTYLQVCTDTPSLNIYGINGEIEQPSLFIKAQEYFSQCEQTYNSRYFMTVASK